MKTICLICFLNLILLSSCETNNEKDDIIQSINTEDLIKSNTLKVSLNTGIAGTLLKKEGNCMPMIGGSGNTSCKTYPVRRTIMIYNYSTTNDVDGWAPFYKTVHSKLVAQVNADQDGFFQVAVDPGKYSIFIKENNSFYANSYDAQSGIQPVTVASDSMNIITLILDYAVY
jgi:hypothetical protein